MTSELYWERSFEELQEIFQNHFTFSERFAGMWAAFSAPIWPAREDLPLAGLPLYDAMCRCQTMELKVYSCCVSALTKQHDGITIFDKIEQKNPSDLDYNFRLASGIASNWFKNVHFLLDDYKVKNNGPCMRLLNVYKYFMDLYCDWSKFNT